MTSAGDSVLAVCRRGAAEQDARAQAPSAVIRFTALARVQSLFDDSRPLLETRCGGYLTTDLCHCRVFLGCAAKWRIPFYGPGPWEHHDDLNL